MMMIKNLLALLLCCCAALSAASPRPGRHPPRSPPLDSSETWNNLITMCKDARARDRDHETRLIPRIPSEKLTDGRMCCGNVKILEYYLSHILHQANDGYSRIKLVHSELRRVARDLGPHCSSNLAGQDHFLSFTENLQLAGQMYKSNATAQNKAIGETDILFHYLYETCRPLA